MGDAVVRPGKNLRHPGVQHERIAALADAPGTVHAGDVGMVTGEPPHVGHDEGAGEGDEEFVFDGVFATATEGGEPRQEGGERHQADEHIGNDLAFDGDGAQE